jgi:hypothetical protein
MRYQTNYTEEQRQELLTGAALADADRICLDLVPGGGAVEPSADLEPLFADSPYFEPFQGGESIPPIGGSDD